MNPESVTTQTPYKLQMWPAHLLAVAASGVMLMSVAYPSATRQYTWPWAALLALLWLTPLVATIGRFCFQNSWTWPNGLLTTGLAFLTGVTLLSAAFSPFAEHSLSRIWPTFGGVALFFWLYSWLTESIGYTRNRSQLLAKGLAGSGAFLAVVSVLGWSWNNGGFSWMSRNDFPFGHSIYTAGAMLLILPWLIRAALKTKGMQRAAWSAAAATGFFALLATSSRGGVMGAGVVGVITAGFVVVRASWPHRIKVGVLVLVTGVLIIAVWSNPRLRELSRLQGWSAASQESNSQRSAMLEAGTKLGAARPLMGWGPGTVPLAYPLMRSQLAGGVDNVLELHSTPAQLWATLGGGGVLASVLLLAAFVRRLVGLGRQARPDTISLSAAASLLGYGFFILTDHQLDVPAMNVLLIINAVLFFAEERAYKTIVVTRTGIWCWSLIGTLILAVPLLFTGRDLLARYAYDQSLILYEDGRPEDGMKYLETAALRAPYDPYYRHQIAGRLLEQRDQATEPGKRAELTEVTITQLEKSLDAGCLQEFAHFNLGWLFLEIDRPADAIPHFLATVHDAPHRSGAYFGLGLALRGNGNEPAAVRAFALEWINDPVSFTAPLWEWPDFAPLRPKVRHEADALLAELIPSHPAAGYLRDLWRWWEIGTAAPVHGFNTETDVFIATLSEINQGQSETAAAVHYAWGPLLKGWRQAPMESVFADLVKNDRSFAAALARRAVRHPAPDVRGFLTAGLESEPDLLLNTRFSRLGYGVLALHPDGPVLTNLYVMQQNRLVATFASTLFPPKGWIPARDLLSRLPPMLPTP